MPDIRLTDALKTKIDAQPERKPPLMLSMNKAASILIDEALQKRREALKKPKLKAK